MFKAFIFKQGKLLPAFNGSQYQTLEKLNQSVKWYFESNRIDKSTQFVVIKDERIIQIINIESI